MNIYQDINLPTEQPLRKDTINWMRDYYQRGKLNSIKATVFGVLTGIFFWIWIGLLIALIQYNDTVTYEVLRNKIIISLVVFLVANVVAFFIHVFYSAKIFFFVFTEGLLYKNPQRVGLLSLINYFLMPIFIVQAMYFKELYQNTKMMLEVLKQQETIENHA